MQRHHNLGVFIFALVILWLAVPQKASAYVDPGNGAMAWQILAATFLGMFFCLRKLVARIHRMWARPSDHNKLNSKLNPPSSVSAGD